MLSILILINGWRNKTVRGGDYHILRVLKNWGKEHDVSIIMPKLGYEPASAILSSRCSIYISSKGEGNVEAIPAVVVSYLLRMVRSLFFVNRREHDIIIASSHLLYDILPAVFLRRRYKSKLVVYVFHIFGSFRTYKQGIWSSISLLSEGISLFLCRKANLIFVDNAYIKDDLIAKGFQEDRIFVTSNGVEHEFIDSIKVGLKEFEGCFCGSLDKRKGVYDLLEVWERVLTNLPKSRLVIIGQGQEYHTLLRKVREKGLDETIMLAGYLSEEQKISMMKSSKLFIFPSYEEGWGIAVSEAMACGLPVVCYDLPAYKAFGSGVIKIQVGNKETMAKAVNDLLMDQNKQKDAGLNAKEAAKQLNWDRIAIEELKEINKLPLV